MSARPSRRRTPSGSERPPAPPARRRLVAVLSVLTIGFLAIVGRLVQVQILEHRRFLEAGREQRSGTDRVRALRGDIVTRDQVLLARSVLCYRVGLDPAFLRSEDSTVRAVRAVAGVLELPGEVRRERLRAALRARADGRRWVRLARCVEPGEEVRCLEAARAVLAPPERRAVRAVPASRRNYPREDLLGPVIGVTNAFDRGLEGLESEFDDFLSCRPGRRRVIKDARQRMLIFYPENSVVAPIHGYDIVLTIDSRAQRILEEELDDGLRRYGAESGVGIVMDCQNGDVLAMASAPRYEPGHYHRYPAEERARRRKNRAIENEYEPGSVLKPIVASWALEQGVTHPEEMLWNGTPGRYLLLEGRRPVQDVSDNTPVTMEKAVYKSSNIGMSLLGLRLGGERLQAMLRAFGFGRPTGIGLPGESPGYIRPAEDWSELYTSVSVSFGYAVRVTPLQLCRAFCAVVNGGTLYRPRLVLRAERGDEVLPNPTEVAGRPLSPETSRTMREILRKVVEADGTGRYLRMRGFRFGGKSGTADIGREGYTESEYLASFEAFAPWGNPRLVVLVMMERPTSEPHYGAWVAGPIAARFLRRWFRVEDEPRLVRMGLDAEGG